MAELTTLIEPKLAAWIAGRPAVAAACPEQVFPFMKVPQRTPGLYVTYHRVTGRRLRSLSGPTTGVSHPLIQIDVWGTDYTAVKLLAAALRDDLEKVLPGTEIGGHRVQACIVDDERDEGKDPLHGDELSEFRVSMDATVWFEEQSA